jgi:hypothetical protein
MSQDPKPEPLPRMRIKKLRCRRTGQMFTVAEHAECPYCFSDSDTIAKGGTYESFCEFHPGKDPVNFGFPPDSTRTEEG